MNRLLEIGFEPAGHWVLEGTALRFELTRHASQKNILYAFVCDGEVKYVGKTVRTLAQRMRGYKAPRETQTTNINNHHRIKETLTDDVPVEILTLPDTGLLRYGEFHLNLAAALEDDIIRVLRPEWNGRRSEDAVGLSEPLTTEPGAVLTASGHNPHEERDAHLVSNAVAELGYRPIKNLAAPLDDDITQLLEPEWNGERSEGAVRSSEPSTTGPGAMIPTAGTLSFILHPTYYRTGFFNVGVSSQRFLGADGETIQLFLGNKSQPIQGYINRRANLNGTPRIMGGTHLRDWFQANADAGDRIVVDVFSRTSIGLRSSSTADA